MASTPVEHAGGNCRHTIAEILGKSGDHQKLKGQRVEGRGMIQPHNVLLDLEGFKAAMAIWGDARRFVFPA